MDAPNDSVIEDVTVPTISENSPASVQAKKPAHIAEGLEEIGAMAVEAAAAEPETDLPQEQAPAIAPEAARARPTAVGGDTVDLELALQFQDMKALGFEGAVAAAVASIGGELLFEMPALAEAGGDRVAAVSLGSGDGRLLALVILPGEGQPPRIEPADTSSNPVAGIVAAYAGLMEHFAIAA